MTYEVQLDSFQGPLELLYKLVKKNKIEISEISLAKITEQYMEYINKIKQFDLDIASEFMMIAVELIEIKAEYLLPKKKNETEDESNEKNLVQRLKEYELFKNISEILRKKEEKAENIYFHPSKLTEEEEIELDLTIEPLELKEAFYQVLKSQDKDQQTDSPNDNVSFIQEEDIKIEDKIEEVMGVINTSGTGIHFYKLIANKNNNMEIIVTLLSILELMKLRRVEVRQNDLFSDIEVIARKEQVV